MPSLPPDHDLRTTQPTSSYLYVFGALYYPTNDNEDLGKLEDKSNVGIFIGYAPAKKAYQIYNRHTRRIMETIHVDFDELSCDGFKQSSSVLQFPPSVDLLVPEVACSRNCYFTITHSLTSVDQDALSPSTSQTPQESPSQFNPPGVEKREHDMEVAHMDNDPYVGLPILEPSSKESSSRLFIPNNVH
ncbi:retrovirus-related pol polyprotein from transposon TNT 1-94 [Tanacetum coccineum]|uniref:Retrovirus-related pol polyprotein from transposon TNT 1-94 n=1 Tax=Tanacetum coccineum TaxID=301880 RepID=A0ABQ5JCU3_9ASTR